MRESFSEELYEQLSLDQSPTKDLVKSSQEIRDIALKLARDPKYVGIYANFTFGQFWLRGFRNKFKVKSKNGVTIKQKQVIIHYMDANPYLSDKEISQHFSTVFKRKIWPKFFKEIRNRREEIMNYKGDLEDQIIEGSKEVELKRELYEETCFRQSLTDENLTTFEKLRPLAVELAAHEKYKGFFSSFKFSKTWVYHFRKKFNLVEAKNFKDKK